VLVVPIPPPREVDADEPPSAQDQQLAFSRSSTSHTNPFTPIWANEKWKNLLHGTDLLQCLDMQGARRFGDWISGARAAKKDRRDSSTSAALETFIGQGGSTSRKRAIQVMSDRARAPAAVHLSETTPPEYPEAPEGFWEPEMPPYEDRSTKSDLLSSSDDATGIGAVDDDHPGPHTMTVQLKKPGKVSLEMTKSMMPIYSKSKNGAMTKVITHTFAIITTVPRSALIMNPTPRGIESEIPTIQMSEPDSDGVARPPRKTVLPNPSSPIRAIAKTLPTATNLDVVPLDADMDTPTDEKPQHVTLGAPARPMIFQKDGSVKRQQSAFPDGAMDNGKSLDVHVLLKTTDWSKTGLGPMDSWPQSLKSAGMSTHHSPKYKLMTVSLVMQYPHQCCLWWGKDLTLLYNAPYSEVSTNHFPT